MIHFSAFGKTSISQHPKPALNRCHMPRLQQLPQVLGNTNGAELPEFNGAKVRAARADRLSAQVGNNLRAPRVDTETIQYLAHREAAVRPAHNIANKFNVKSWNFFP